MALLKLQKKQDRF